MSSHLVLNRSSFALRGILWEAIQLVPAVRGPFNSTEDISFSNPTETHANRSLKLSLWMYQVAENEHLKNQPPERINGGTAIQVMDTPLALNLYYLVTPFMETAEQDLELLGLVMRALYDNPTIYIDNPVDNIYEELRVILCRLNLEELTRIWEALREPYRLSVCYQVRVTRIDSSRIARKGRVIEANNDYGNISTNPTG